MWLLKKLSPDFKTIFELPFRNRAEHHGRVMKLYKYKSTECANCQFKSKCTRNPRGRIISRWEYEEMLEKMKKRVENNREKVNRRQWLVEHPFGTLKGAFNQGYMRMKGIEKVAGEISLSILAYNIKRVINIVGLKGLILAL
jgi:hypothetical protein